MIKSVSATNQSYQICQFGLSYKPKTSDRIFYLPVSTIGCDPPILNRNHLHDIISDLFDGKPTTPGTDPNTPDAWKEHLNCLAVSLIPCLKNEKYDANPSSIGQLFVDFLQFYATFDFENAISVRLGSEMPKLKRREWKFICIEDPFSRFNVSSSVHVKSTFDRIVDVFRSSHDRLISSCSLESLALK